MFRFVGAVLIHADIIGLLFAEAGKFGADLVQMQAGDLFIQALGQRVNFIFVFSGVTKNFHLRQGLVGE